jgi:hypothetical protein
MPSQESQALDESKSFGELGKLGLFSLELAGMDTAAESAHPDGMLEMKHLVVQQIFNGVAGA